MESLSRSGDKRHRDFCLGLTYKLFKWKNKASARVGDRDWTRSVCKCGRVGNVMKMQPRNAGQKHRPPIDTTAIPEVVKHKFTNRTWTKQEMIRSRLFLWFLGKVAGSTLALHCILSKNRAKHLIASHVLHEWEESGAGDLLYVLTNRSTDRATCASYAHVCKGKLYLTDLRDKPAQKERARV